MSIDNKYVLVLNNNWIPIGVKNVRDAITSVYENSYWNIIAVNYIDNEPQLHVMTWKEWVKQDIPNCCDVINTQHMQLRTPTIIISSRYKKVHYKKQRPSLENIYKRDKGICQWTGKRLNRSSSSIDHVIPKCRGGQDTWENMVLCDKTVNSKKSDKLPSEIGLKLINEPKEPKPITAMETVNTYHRDWEMFLAK